MSAHTPGPWDWFTNPLTDSKQGGRDCMRFIVAANGQGLAHTVGLSSDEDEANARLIAVSTQLLASLRNCVYLLTSAQLVIEDRASRDIAAEAVAEAQAIIKRAEGT